MIFLQDDESKQQFMVDTGAVCSVLPHRSKTLPTGPQLSGADGRAIPCWGMVRRRLSFGLRTFFVTFLLAAVYRPGLDFLSAHGLLVDPVVRQVLDSKSLKPLSKPATTARTLRSKFAAALCSGQFINTAESLSPSFLSDLQTTMTGCPPPPTRHNSAPAPSTLPEELLLARFVLVR
jgi:hypothetical protein